MCLGEASMLPIYSSTHKGTFRLSLGCGLSKDDTSKMLLYLSYVDVDSSFPPFQFPHLIYCIYCANALNNSQQTLLCSTHWMAEVQRSKTEMCNLRALQHVFSLSWDQYDCGIDCGFNNCQGLPPNSCVGRHCSVPRKPDFWRILVKSRKPPFLPFDHSQSINDRKELMYMV